MDRKFKASKELLEVLIKNGLKIQNYLYSSEAKRFIHPFKLESYDPGGQKVAVGLTRNKAKLELYFNYNLISVVERSVHVTSHLIEMTESELRSIITYFKLSHYQRGAIRRYTHDQIERAGYFMRDFKKVLQDPEYPFNQKFEILFEEVIL